MCQYDHDIPHSSGGMLHILETNHIQEINYRSTILWLKFKPTLVHTVIYVYVCIYI